MPDTQVAAVQLRTSRMCTCPNELCVPPSPRTLCRDLRKILFGRYKDDGGDDQDKCAPSCSLLAPALSAAQPRRLSGHAVLSLRTAQPASVLRTPRASPALELLISDADSRRRSSRDAKPGSRRERSRSRERGR